MDEYKVHSLKLHRDEDGNLIPVQGISPMLQMDVKVVPFTYGQSKTYDSFGKSIFEWTEEERMRLINEHVVVPEIELDSIKDMEENYDAFVIEDLVHAVLIISGMGRFYDPDSGNVVGEES